MTSRRGAEALLLEQTVELPRAAVRDPRVVSEILGSVEELGPDSAGGFRGAGRLLVGHEVFELRALDLVRVPPRMWRQFRAASDAALCFLCLVDCEHDRPVRPTPEELEALRQRPEVAAFIRA